MSLNLSITFIKFLSFQNPEHPERENKIISYIPISSSLIFPFNHFLFLLHYFSISIISCFFFLFWLFNFVVLNCMLFQLSWESPPSVWFQVSWKLSLFPKLRQVSWLDFPSWIDFHFCFFLTTIKLIWVCYIGRELKTFLNIGDH